MSDGSGSEDMDGVSVAAEGSWERKRLYFRRKGAHSEWASPIMRIALMGSGEMWRVASVSRGGAVADREVDGEV